MNRTAYGRIISFRGKKTRFKKWTYGFLVNENNGTAWISRYFHRGEWEQVDPLTTGQSTGLHDAKRNKEFPNGQEAFEGDIVSIPNLVGKIKNYIDVIVFQNGAFVLEKAKDILVCQELMDEGTIIIGNVHDNPDLLSDQDEPDPEGTGQDNNHETEETGQDEKPGTEEPGGQDG